MLFQGLQFEARKIFSHLPGAGGGFPKLGANLRTFQQISNALEDDIFTQVHFRVIQEVWQPHFASLTGFETIQNHFLSLKFLQE
jgi:hypothetical protein